MDPPRSFFSLLFLSALLLGASAYSIEGLYPNAGPIDGYTRVTIYSSGFAGMTHETYPTPMCRFKGSDAIEASWIHCVGLDTSPNATRSEVCLNCESPPHTTAEDVTVEVSVTGEFTDTVTTSFHYYLPPTVSWAEPFIGRKTGGTIVNVFGSNFENLQQLGCVFGTIIVPAKFVSSTMITCIAPASDAVDTPIPLKVTQNVQQATYSDIHYFYYSVPEISILVPESGPTTGGTQVYIQGRQMYPFQTSNLDIANTTFVRFGKYKVKGTLINTTHALCTSPASYSEGKVPVELTFNDQEYTSNGVEFLYYIPPYVMDIIPKFGPISGGTKVTVIGANYWDSGEIKCKFGDQIADGTFINETAIWCYSPQTTQGGYVPFSLSMSKDRYSGADLKYMYVDPPVVSSVLPPCGPTSGFTQIAIVGQNFIYVGMQQAVCIFGDNIRQPATVVNNTLMYCDSPSVLDKFGNNVNDIQSLSLKITLNQVDLFDTNTNFTYYTENFLSLVTPNNGPLTGGTNVTIVVGISNYCALTCRFATMKVPAVLNPDNTLTCTTPAVTCPGQTVVQVSFNDQQYTKNLYDSHNTLFYYHPDLVIAYVTPHSVPTSGGATVTIYGENFLMSRNSTMGDTGRTVLEYTCRYSKAGTVLGTTTASYVDNNIVKCPTPHTDAPIDGADLQISSNGQNWDTVAYSKINFYLAPEITSINPKFGKIKQKGTTLNVVGTNFICPDSGCAAVRCSFSSSDLHVITEGTLQSSTLIVCQIPPISRPEITAVQITLNGIDYTTSNATYTFYDAFVLSVDPPYVPVEGNTVAKVLGYGFADTGSVNVKLVDSTDGKTLVCGGNQPCVLPATYISQNEIHFTVPPQASVTDETGTAVGFNPFKVEVSVFGNEYTSNGVEIQYFQQPSVGALTSDGSPKRLHVNTLDTVRIPVTLNYPPGISKTVFLNYAKLRCKFNVGAESIVTVGLLVNYPFPTDPSTMSDAYTRIECPTPRFTAEGTGAVSVAINGKDFVGNNPILVRSELKIVSVAPKCGPKEGGTQTVMSVQGFDSYDLGSLFFSWSTVCTALITEDLFKSADNTISTVTPAVPYLDSSPGGPSLAVFSLFRTAEFIDGTNIKSVQHYLDSSAEFLYYQAPLVLHTFPHSGAAAGGTPVLIEGAFFFSDKKHSCTPKCFFGDQIVEAEFIDTTRIRCISPAGQAGVTVPLAVSMNGQDTSPVLAGQTFAFAVTPVISSINPSSGPTSGGTNIEVYGPNFVDLSQYPDEFLCVFTSDQLKQAPKRTPARFLNSTTILCPSPGGWGAGTIATVQVTYNGQELSNNNNQFRFFQVDTIVPLSGPAEGGSTVTIRGSGFESNPTGGAAACKIDEQVTPATFTNWTHIVCPVPAAKQGPAYDGHVDFYYTLDGRDWHRIYKGFTYYQQPEISEVIPPFLSTEGGKLGVRGKYFLYEYYGTDLNCKVGDSLGYAVYVNDTFIYCEFSEVFTNRDKQQYLSVSLNSQSYTAASEATKVNVFSVTNMSPKSGIITGGTQITIEGQNFPTGFVPLCRFGVAQATQTVSGYLVNSQQLICTAPAITKPDNAAYPLEVMFSLNFGDDDYKTWAWQGLHYTYYNAPEVLSLTPTSALVDQNTMVTITSTTDSTFGDGIIGSRITTDAQALQQDIKCRFGRFGTSEGVLLNQNQIACPTPNTNLNLDEIGEEPVKVEVSLNGQDYSSNSNVYFKFIGSRSPSLGITWIIAIIIGSVVLIFLIYYISTSFSRTAAASNNQNQSFIPKQPVVANAQPAAQGNLGGPVQGPSYFNQSGVVNQPQPQSGAFSQQGNVGGGNIRGSNRPYPASPGQGF